MNRNFSDHTQEYTFAKITWQSHKWMGADLNSQETSTAMVWKYLVYRVTTLQYNVQISTKITQHTNKKHGPFIRKKKKHFTETLRKTRICNSQRY